MDQPYDWQTEAITTQGRAAMYVILNLPFATGMDTPIPFLVQMRSLPVTALLEALAGDEAGSELAAGAGEILAFLKDSLEEDPERVSETLAIERTRLFRGISPEYGPPPPYETVWSLGESENATIQGLASIYRQAGLAPAEEQPERPDYIGLELEFMRRLALEEARAWENQDNAIALSLRRKQMDFLHEHVGAWAPAFIAEALKETHTGFFHGYLRALGGFLAEEGAAI